MGSTVEAVARQFEHAARTGLDASELFASDAVVWKSFDGRERDLDRVRREAEYERGVVPDITVATVGLHIGDGGFTWRYAATGHAAGTPVAMDVCAVHFVVDGVITRVEEYVDSAQAQALLR